MMPPLILDFAKEKIAGTLDILRSEATKHSFLVPVLKFCEEWVQNNEQFIFLTSGSTGPSKDYLVQKKQILASVRATCNFFNLTKGDAIFNCLNPVYTGGKMMIARALFAELKLHLVPPSNFPFSKTPDHFFKLTSLVPSQLFTLFQAPDCDQYLYQFQNIIVGGAAVHQDLRAKCKNINRCTIYESFGMTETISHIALRKLSNINREQPFETLPGIEVDSDESDCLRIKGPVTNDIWLETRDVVEILDPTHFYWRGRFDNIINSGGIKINPEEIENTIFRLLNSRGIEHFYISSEEDVKYGQKLILIIEGDEIHTDLLPILKDILPEHHAPTKIIYQKDFKRTLSGKIIRTI